jgi:hypothetical protein
MRAWAKRAGIAMVVLIVGIQFVRPARTNPLEEPEKTIFADVAVWQGAPKTIERACIDCHSSRTRWPWYSQVAPVSWLVAHDVAEGREHMDLSTWSKYDVPQKSALLADACKLVKSNSMPLPIYIIMHGEAKLTEQERQEICAWAEGARAQLDAARK